MRRILLILTVLCLAGWSQPAQQQAQPPTVVKVEVPPANPWMRMLELVTPGIIGAGLALLGVWFTNRNNAATNAANRQHQFDVEVAKAKIAAEYRSQDNRWAFRKDVYVTLVEIVSGLKDLRIQLVEIEKAESAVSSDKMNQLASSAEQKAANLEQYAALYEKFVTHLHIAQLATANNVIRTVLDHRVPEPVSREEEIRDWTAVLHQLSIAGRTELWGIPESTR